MIGAIAAGAGEIIQGFGAWQGQRARAKALRAQARAVRGEASLDAQMRAEEAERTGARAAVIGAATGGGFDGSFGAGLEQIERAGRFNVRSAIYAGETEGRNLEYEAKVAKAEGNLALASAGVAAFSSIAGGFIRQAEQKKQAASRKGLYRKGYGR